MEFLRLLAGPCLRAGGQIGHTVNQQRRYEREHQISSPDRPPRRWPCPAVAGCSRLKFTGTGLAHPKSIGDPEEQQPRQDHRTEGIDMTQRIGRYPPHAQRRVVAKTQSHEPVRCLVQGDREDQRQQPNRKLLHRVSDMPRILRIGDHAAASPSHWARVASPPAGAGSGLAPSPRFGPGQPLGCRVRDRADAEGNAHHLRHLAIAVEGEIATSGNAAPERSSKLPDRAPIDRSSVTSTPSKPISPRISSRDHLRRTGRRLVRIERREHAMAGHTPGRIGHAP